MGDSKGNSYLPIWPAIEYANLYAINEWKDYKPQKIEIHEFIDNTSIGLRNKGINICPFPVLEMPNIIICLDDFISNIQHELTQYE